MSALGEGPRFAGIDIARTASRADTLWLAIKRKLGGENNSTHAQLLQEPVKQMDYRKNYV